MWDLLQDAFGVASIVALAYTIWPHIFGRDKANRKYGVIALGAFLVLTGAVWLWSPTGYAGGGVKQTDTMQVSDRQDDVLQVFYPRAYQHPPNLKIWFVKGKGDFEIVEQLPTGFKFRIRNVLSSMDEGAEIQWLATGDPAK